jgi:hypothetical protein
VSTREIRFGLRRYPLMVPVFGALGAGFVYWSRSVDRPTFVFPFGTLDPENASLAFLFVGIAAFAYLAIMSYVRFVLRPVVVLGEGVITLPQGEFGQRNVTLCAGSVTSVRQSAPRAGGWRTCYVEHTLGRATLHSSQLPDDESYFAVCEALDGLIRK